MVNDARVLGDEAKFPIEASRLIHGFPNIIYFSTDGSGVGSHVSVQEANRAGIARDNDIFLIRCFIFKLASTFIS